MFLKLNHQKLDIYSKTRLFVKECNKLASQLPPDEKFGLSSQIKRAALSVHLNVAEGASRKSESERKRYFEIARGSVIETDAVLDIANDLAFHEKISLDLLGKSTIDCFKFLTIYN